MTFKKGDRGNPGGRPANITLVKELARKHTPEAIQALVDVMHQTDGSPSARVAAAEALINRAWGKPEQAVELTGDLIENISVIVGMKTK